MFTFIAAISQSKDIKLEITNSWNKSLYTIMASKSEDSIQEAKLTLCMNPFIALEWAPDTHQIR
jgi:hypothetical protein